QGFREGRKRRLWSGHPRGSDRTATGGGSLADARFSRNLPGQVDDLLKHHLTPVIGDLEVMRKLESAAQRRGAKLDFHLKIDTGMSRIGFLPDERRSWLPEIAKLKALKLEGILSIFSHADSPEGSYTQNQLKT